MRRLRLLLTILLFSGACASKPPATAGECFFGCVDPVDPPATDTYDWERRYSLTAAEATSLREALHIAHDLRELHEQALRDLRERCGGLRMALSSPDEERDCEATPRWVKRAQRRLGPSASVTIETGGGVHVRIDGAQDADAAKTYASALEAKLPALLDLRDRIQKRLATADADAATCARASALGDAPDPPGAKRGTRAMLKLCHKAPLDGAVDQLARLRSYVQRIDDVIASAATGRSH